MHVGKKTQKREKSAMTLSLYGSLVFAIVEIGMAVFSGSQAVLLDAVYDSVEFFMMLPSIFLIPLIYRPASEQHPFGFTQVETGFVVVKGAIMAAVTFGLIFNNIHLLLHGGHIVSFNTISAFELFACALSLTMAICLFFKNKHMSSPIVNIELQTWKIDCVVSLGMAIAFLLPIIVPFAWFQRLTPYLDQIITIVLSAFMLPTPIKTVITGLRDLMLWPPEAETVDDIKATIEPIIGGYGHKNLYYDIVRTGRKLWISVYITFDRDIISLSKFQILQTKCIAALAVCLIFNAVAKGYLKQLSVLVGLIVGYIIALCMGQVDLSGMLDGGLISLPHLLPYRPEFNLSAIISVAIIFMVSAAETIGDSTALVSGGLGREITEKEISGALACDGFASSISGLFGCPPVTSFSQNVGLVNMTKVVNRFTIMTGAVFMILAGLFPPIGNFFASLPQSVLGGCTIMMFGTIMISGIQMLAKTGFSQRNVTIAALSLAIGIGFTSTSEVEIWNIFPQIVKDVFSANCVAVVFVVAIILSLILPKNMEIEKISE